MTALPDDERHAIAEFIYWYVLNSVQGDPDADELDAAVDRLARAARVRRMLDSGEDPIGELGPWRDEMAETARIVDSQREPHRTEERRT